MKKSYYSILILNALALSFSWAAPSSLAAGETGSPAKLTEADFAYGGAATGSGFNTTTYSIAPNTAYDNMGYQQSNTTAAGTPISDYYSQADQNSAANSSATQLTKNNIPNSRGGLPSCSTGSLGTTLANDLDPLGKNSIQSGKYNFGFTGKVLPSFYAASRGISLPQVGTGSIIMNGGFTPR
jgi:hypothetical protein